jgi:hypothetical protein
LPAYCVGCGLKRERLGHPCVGHCSKVSKVYNGLGECKLIVYHVTTPVCCCTVIDKKKGEICRYSTMQGLSYVYLFHNKQSENAPGNLIDHFLCICGEGRSTQRRQKPFLLFRAPRVCFRLCPHKDHTRSIGRLDVSFLPLVQHLHNQVYRSHVYSCQSTSVTWCASPERKKHIRIHESVIYGVLQFPSLASSSTTSPSRPRFVAFVQYMVVHLGQCM